MLSLLVASAASATTVTRILDGDTLDIREDSSLIRVRLADIDAPEKNQPFGQRSKQMLTELVRNAQDIRIQATGEDRYGRTLANVYVKKCQPQCLAYQVNEELIKNGMAWAYRYHGHATNSAMEQLEMRAREEKRGLWSVPGAIEPWRHRAQEKLR
ncbi:thermonuclease family protein [Salmonella enterica]|nr:thermonuclease family protein [Salmonella enterica]